MKYKMMPVVEASKLEEGLRLQYGNAFMEKIGNDIPNFLFPGDYMNDCYKSLYIEGGDEEEDEEDQLRNCIYAYLQDVMPKGTEVVLIDVSW